MDEIIQKLMEDLKKQKIEKNYSLLGLKFNPFSPAGLPRFILPPLDPNIEKVIFQFISSTYIKQEYAGLTIVGDYGMGKTHLMMYIQTLINELTEKARESKIDFSAVTCFIDRPEDSPQRVVHKIIEEIGLDNIRKYIWKMAIDNFREDKDSFYEEFKSKLTLLQYPKEKWNILFEEPAKSNYLEFLKQFRELGGNLKLLQESVREMIRKEIVSDSALADRYLNLVLFPGEREADISWDILAGYVSKRDIQRKEIIFLTSIVKILQKVGFKQLYVFVDEFEDIGKLTTAKQTNYLLTLTTLINRERKWALIISLPEVVLEEVIKKQPPLYDRLNSWRVSLKPLGERKCRELLTNYLNLARDKEGDFFPFSKECIKKMLEISKSNSRSFLLLAYNSIEIARMENKSQIDEEIVEKAKELRGM